VETPLGQVIVPEETKGQGLEELQGGTQSASSGLQCGGQKKWADTR